MVNLSRASFSVVFFFFYSLGAMNTIDVTCENWGFRKLLLGVDRKGVGANTLSQKTTAVIINLGKDFGANLRPLSETPAIVERKQGLFFDLEEVSLSLTPTAERGFSDGPGISPFVTHCRIILSDTATDLAMLAVALATGGFFLPQ